MNTVIISVLPIQVGWVVQQEPGGEPLVFLSGGRAEAAARRIAEASSATGAPAELRIQTRDGHPVHTVSYP